MEYGGVPVKYWRRQELESGRLDEEAGRQFAMKLFLGAKGALAYHFLGPANFLFAAHARPRSFQRGYQA